MSPFSATAVWVVAGCADFSCAIAKKMGTANRIVKGRRFRERIICFIRLSSHSNFTQEGTQKPFALIHNHRTALLIESKPASDYDRRTGLSLMNVKQCFSRSLSVVCLA